MEKYEVHDLLFVRRQFANLGMKLAPLFEALRFHCPLVQFASLLVGRLAVRG